MGLVEITPNKEKAKSILTMCNVTLDMIKEINPKYASNIIKEYYEVLRELSTIILLLDGYKSTGEGAHKNIIDYIEGKNILTEYEIILFNDLREKRNRIAYDGFVITESFLKRKNKDILKIIDTLKKYIATSTESSN